MQDYKDKSESYFAHARVEVAPLLPKHCGRVLEIGCGAGATLAWLRHAGLADHTVGVEISQEAARVAQTQVDDVHCLDFERDGGALRQQFDVILCLDVLEHMVDPWGVLDRLVSKNLADGGTLVASLPNIRHYSVLLPLIFQGRWDYEEAGLLDRTHLRFFTRRSAVMLLTHPQLSAIRYLAPGFEMPSSKALVNALTFGLFREFLTYQHLLCARKLQ